MSIRRPPAEHDDHAYRLGYAEGALEHILQSATRLADGVTDDHAKYLIGEIRRLARRARDVAAGRCECLAGVPLDPPAMPGEHLHGVCDRVSA